MAKSARNNTLPAEECALFAEQTAMVLKAGLPLHEGIESLAESQRGSRYAEQFKTLFRRVCESGTLYEAVSKAGVFPQYFCAMVRIGERTGKLDEVMSALNSYYSWEAGVRRSLHNAVLYPAVLVVMLAVVIGILTGCVLPVFDRVFDSLGVSANAASGAAMHAGTAIGTAVLAVIGVLLAAVIVIAILLKTRNGERVFNWLCAVVPAIGRASMTLSAGRFCSAASMMLQAGSHPEEIMELAPMVVNDGRYAKKLGACAEQVKGGTPFAQAMEDAGLFDGLQGKILRFGAAAGQLDNVMAELRETYMQQADESIGGIVSAIEPTLVAVLSIVIGGILLAVMLPLISVLSAIA